MAHKSTTTHACFSSNYFSALENLDDLNLQTVPNVRSTSNHRDPLYKHKFTLEQKGCNIDQRCGYRRGVISMGPMSLQHANKLRLVQGDGFPTYQAPEKTPPKLNLPPRLQVTANRMQSTTGLHGFCGPTPHPLPGIHMIRDRLSCPENGACGAPLRRSKALEPQTLPCNIRPRNAVLESLPITNPRIPPIDAGRKSTPKPDGSVFNKQNDQGEKILPTPIQRDSRIIREPSIHDIISRPAPDFSALFESSDKITVSFPPPPGLPSRPIKPTGQNSQNSRQSRRVYSTKFNGHRQNVADLKDYANINPIQTPVPSPPPIEISPSIVRLPSSGRSQPAPRSPSTASSSVFSEGISGSSSVVFSDTTTTSVESGKSNRSFNPRRRVEKCVDYLQGRACAQSPCPYVHTYKELCRNWLNGYPCFKDPCPYFHLPEVNVPDTSSTTPSVAVNPTTRTSQEPPPLYATTISDHIKVKFGQGFEVREVLTGFESRWVHLGNVSPSVSPDELKKLLAPYGQIDTLNIPEASGRPLTVKVQFATAANAMKAATELNGAELNYRGITAKLAINNTSKGNTVIVDTDAQVTWECPRRVGYAGYATLKKAKAVVEAVNGLLMDHIVVSAALYDGLPAVGAYNVILHNLPASVTEGDIRKFGDAESIMLERPNYASLEKTIKLIRSRLEECGTVHALDVLPPPFKDGIVKAWARFSSPTEARTAQDMLDGRRPVFIGKTTLSVRHVVSMSHVLSASAYMRMREDIAWLRWSWQRRYGSGVTIAERGNIQGINDSPVYIRLSSEDAGRLSTLKYEFEQLLHGETVMIDKKPAWDDFFSCPAGLSFISQLQDQYSGIEIQVQRRRRVVSLWGPIVKRHRARQDIVRKVVELKSQQFWHIPLSGRVLGIFLSAELTNLQENLGAENCFLDYGRRTLVVRGNENTFRVACKAAQEAQSRQGEQARSSAIICPVCFNDATVPVSLECGHKWCRSCLIAYLVAAVDNKTFPLTCLGNDATCTHRIPLGLARKLLSAAEFNAVVEAAFWSYVHSRSDEFYHCPTPDCMQVYRSAPANAVLQCPSCLLRICPACRIEYHDGLTCEERDVAEDKLFLEWTSNHDVKCCPSCKVPIERSEGCNHMTCTRCQTHICWECLATFPRGDGIYHHMRSKHGGIGL